MTYRYTIKKSFDESIFNKNKIKKCPKIIKIILEKLPKTGEFIPLDIIKENEKNITFTCSHDTFRGYHYLALKIGVKCDFIIKKLIKLERTISDLETVQYWQSQLRGSKYKNLKSETFENNSTKGRYLWHLDKFNQWLVPKEFQIKKTVTIGDNTFKVISQKHSFVNIEELLKLFDESPSSIKDIKKIIRQYLIDPIHGKSSASYMNIKFSAIASYFEIHDSPLGMRFNKKKFDTQEIKIDSEMTLDELYKILTDGKPTIMEKSIMLIKFQGGFDSSTMADRFNFEGLRQITKYFGSEDHNSWDLDKCPVLLKTIRMKNGYQHTPLVDRDSIESIQRYLDWRINKYGSHEIDGPLYFNSFGNPIRSTWISTKFFELAVEAGVQKKISDRKYKINSHENRDLLKSTLIDNGCRQDVAEAIVGHMPKDTYEKQNKLYPETMRKEYAKGSKKLNIFSKFTSVINGTDDSDFLKSELSEKIKEVDNLLKKQREQTITRYQDEFFAKNQQKQMNAQENTMNDLLKTVNDLKLEIKLLKKNPSEKLEFCCIGCSTIHDKSECPTCGSKLKRIFEESVQG